MLQPASEAAINTMANVLLAEKEFDIFIIRLVNRGAAIYDGLIDD